MAGPIAVTGLGAVTPCGIGLEPTWESVVEGRSPIRAIERFPLCGAATQVGGMVPGYEHQHGNGSLALEFTRTAIREALADAGLPAAPGMFVLGYHGERRLPAQDGPTVAMTADDLRRTVAADIGATESMAVFGACAAGGQTVALGAEAIRSGRVDAVVCVGADSLLNDFDFFQFVNLYAMSTRACPPAEASCPFDARRDGFVLSEGAACIVLESVAHARGRGARVRAYVMGVAMSQSAHHMIASPPDALGPILAMRHALRDAGLDGEEIGYVNAHGTSTRDNDWCETLAIKDVFGSRSGSLPISSTKGVTGHLMGGAGALEVALSVLALEQGTLPPTINLAEPDPRCDLDYVPNEARPARIDHVMTNSFGFGGHNTSIVLGRAG